jgi:hypothetical protein
MKRMMSILSAHKMLAVFLAVLMLVSLTFASISIAKSGTRVELAAEQETTTTCSWYQRRIYYNDAAHTTQTGVRVWFCDGEVGSAGTITIYFDESYCECDEGGL